MSGVIGGFIAVLLVHLITRHAARSKTDGRLAWHAAVTVFAWLLLLASFGLVYVLLRVNHGGQHVELLILIAFFGSAAIGMLLEAYLTGGFFDQERISFRTPWSGSKVQRWADLTDVKFSAWSNLIVLRFRDGTKIRVSTLLNGHGELLQQLDALGFKIELP
jgi:hypothetical protein